MTNEGKRNLSRVEFDNTYFAIDDDIERLISTKFKTEITQGTDLDTLREPGFYYSPSASVTNTLVHSPVTGYNFVMLVLDKGGNKTQVIFAMGSNIYVRTTTGGSFESWFVFTGAEV